MLVRLFLIAEAAELWRLKPRTVRRWVFLRKVTYCKVGGRVRIPESEIVRVVEEGTVHRLAEGFPFEEQLGTTADQMPTQK